MAGRVSSTWKKGEKPPVSKPKGSKHKRTLVKEALGIKNWKDLEGWIDNDGIKKFITEAKKLKGKNYVYALSAILEYVKPKLQRTTHEGNPDNPVQIKNEHRFIIEDMTDGSEHEI